MWLHEISGGKGSDYVTLGEANVKLLSMSCGTWYSPAHRLSALLQVDLLAVALST